MYITITRQGSLVNSPLHNSIQEHPLVQAQLVKQSPPRLVLARASLVHNPDALGPIFGQAARRDNLDLPQ